MNKTALHIIMEAPTNLYRLTYQDTAFQGWRVTITRQKKIFQQYFADKAYGSSQAAREAALRVRDLILETLAANPDKVEELLEQFQKEMTRYTAYPCGLKPYVHHSSGHERIPGTISLRVNPLLYRLINRRAKSQDISTSSVLRLALYSYLSEPCPSGDLYRIIAGMEEKAMSQGFPSFTEFVMGRGGEEPESEARR